MLHARNPKPGYWGLSLPGPTLWLPPEGATCTLLSGMGQEVNSQSPLFFKVFLLILRETSSIGCLLHAPLLGIQPTTQVYALIWHPTSNFLIHVLTPNH